MSRSYRRYPLFQCDRHGAKWAKTHANRLFRRCRREMQAGKSAYHRKYSESRNIHDDYFRWTRADAENTWNREEAMILCGETNRFRIHGHLCFKTKRRYLEWWKKRALRK